MTVKEYARHKYQIDNDDVAIDGLVSLQRRAFIEGAETVIKHITLLYAGGCLPPGLSDNDLKDIISNGY